MKTNNMRWRISPVAWLPIGLAITAEAVSNALRAYGLGAHLDRFTLTIAGHDLSLAGGVLVLAAIAVSLSQTRATWVALTPGPARQRIVAGFAAVLLLAISVTAMASHILEANRAKVADEGGDRARYDRTEAAYKKAESELATLQGVRSIADVRAAMDAAPVSRTVFRRTNQCTDVTREDSQQACKPILDLRVEMGKAIRKQELEPDVERLRVELASLDRPEVATASEDVVSGFWAWIMGLGVVFVATFGPVIFARVETVSANDNVPATVSTVSGNGFPPPKGPRKPRVVPDHPVIAALRSGPVASNDELAQRMGVTKGEASKRRQEVEHLLSVTQAGRCKRIGLAA